VNFDRRLKLYESLYFREIERIEKISARLALPFAAMLSVATILAFMLNAKIKPESEPAHCVFWIFFSGASISLIFGAWFFRKAWFGHSDKLLPTADSIENYYLEICDTYKGYEDSEKLIENAFNEFLFEYYKRFSSENAINNDKRSYNIYRALVAFTVTLLFAGSAAIPFYLGASKLEEIDNVREAATTATTATSKKREGQYSAPVQAAKPTAATAEKEVTTNGIRGQVLHRAFDRNIQDLTPMLYDPNVVAGTPNATDQTRSHLLHLDLCHRLRPGHDPHSLPGAATWGALG